MLGESGVANPACEDRTHPHSVGLVTTKRLIVSIPNLENLYSFSEKALLLPPVSRGAGSMCLVFSSSCILESRRLELLPACVRRALSRKSIRISARRPALRHAGMASRVGFLLRPRPSLRAVPDYVNQLSGESTSGVYVCAM